MKEIEKGDDSLDSAKEMKKQWNMVILIVISSLRTVVKGLEWGLEKWKLKEKLRPFRNSI